MKITGTKNLNRALNRLPRELQNAGEAAVLRAGAKPITKAARNGVPVQSGLLKKSIGSNVKKLHGERTARIGARKGRGKDVQRDGQTVYSNPTKYAHLVEFGTSHSPAKPFIRPAVETTKTQVSTAMAEGYRKYLHRAARRIKSRL